MVELTLRCDRCENVLVIGNNEDDNIRFSDLINQAVDNHGWQIGPLQEINSLILCHTCADHS